MGPGGTPLRHSCYMVPAGWRSLHRVYLHRGPRCYVWPGRFERLVRGPLHRSRLSDYLYPDAQVLVGVQTAWLCYLRRLRERSLRQQHPVLRGRTHRYRSNAAIHRPSDVWYSGIASRARHPTHRIAWQPANRPATADRLPHPGSFHLYKRAARASYDRPGEGSHDLRLADHYTDRHTFQAWRIWCDLQCGQRQTCQEYHHILRILESETDLGLYHAGARLRPGPVPLPALNDRCLEQ